MKAVLTVVAGLALSIVEVSAQTSGTTGSLSWNYNESSKALVITGAGEIPDYEFDKTPWASFKEDITSIKLGEGITAIGNNAFCNCVRIAEVDVPNRVTRIGEAAFQTCISLESITLPESVKSIGEGAFEECSHLTTVKLNEGLEIINGFAFQECAQLSEINFPSTLRTIGRWAFGGCSELTTLEIPAGVTRICDNAFGSCSQLQALHLSEGLQAIEESAFNACEALQEVTLPASVNELGYGIFSDCKQLTHINVKAGNTAYVDEDGILYNKAKTILLQYPAGKADESFTIPSSITEIGDYAFGGNESLKETMIHQQIKRIGAFAFVRCNELKAISVPAQTESIGESAFHDCLSLTTINVAEANPNYVSEDGILYDKAKTQLLQYPAGKQETLYRAPKSLEVVSNFGFFENQALQYVKLPGGLRQLGNFAFGWCKNLKQLTVSVADPSTIKMGMIVFFRGSSAVPCTLRVPIGSKALYEAAEQWADFTPNIEEFEPVGIHQIETDAASRAGKQRIYDLNGNLQQGPLSKLPAGLYIINGKKIIKK